MDLMDTSHPAPPLPCYRAQGPRRLLSPSGTARQHSSPQCHVSEAEALRADAGAQWAVGDMLEKGGLPQGNRAGGRPPPRSTGSFPTLSCLRPAGGAAAQPSGRDPRGGCRASRRCHRAQSRRRAPGPTSPPPPGGAGHREEHSGAESGHLDSRFSLGAVTP